MESSVSSAMMFRSVGLRILWSLLTMTMWLTVVLWLSRLEVKSMKLWETEVELRKRIKMTLDKKKYMKEIITG